MKTTIIMLATLGIPAAILGITASVVAKQILDHVVPGALDQMGTICLALFFGSLFGTWIVLSRLPRLSTTTKI